MTSHVSRPCSEEIWRTYDSAEQRLSAPLSDRMLELAELRPGMNVLDLATGRGEPAVRAAHRVGPNGRVLGVDLSEPMLLMARKRANNENVSNLELKVANIERLPDLPTGFYQAVIARWGLMYLDAPVQALLAARQALSPDGVMVAATWAEPERVPYYTLPRAALAKFATVPRIDQNVPGEFYYADPDRLVTDFSLAGFDIQHIEEVDVEVMEARSAAELITWARAFGMSRILEGVSPETQKEWEHELARLAEPYRRDGYIRLGGITRLVVASVSVSDSWR